MSNHVQCVVEPIAIVSETSPAASAAEITAVALLKLLMRAESGTAAAAEPCGQVGPLPIYDQCEKTLSLSPYLQEQLKSITTAVFNRVNGDFYRAYRDLSPEQPAEIVLSLEDLRPLAYRALMYEGPAATKPFAPRFAASLLLLQKYWDCDFLQGYKDVAGRLSAYSIKNGKHVGRFAGKGRL